MARRSHSHSGERYSRNFDQSKVVFIWLCSRVSIRFCEEVWYLCLQRAGLRRWGRDSPAGTRTPSLRMERCFPHHPNTCTCLGSSLSKIVDWTLSYILVFITQFEVAETFFFMPKYVVMMVMVLTHSLLEEGAPGGLQFREADGQYYFMHWGPLPSSQ